MYEDNNIFNLDNEDHGSSRLPIMQRFKVNDLGLSQIMTSEFVSCRHILQKLGSDTTTSSLQVQI